MSKSKSGDATLAGRVATLWRKRRREREKGVVRLGSDAVSFASHQCERLRSAEGTEEEEDDETADETVDEIEDDVQDEIEDDVEDEVEDGTREEAENNEKDEAEDKENDEVEDEKKDEGEDEKKDEREGEEKDEMEVVAKVVARKEAENEEKDEAEGEEEDEIEEDVEDEIEDDVEDEIEDDVEDEIEDDVEDEIEDDVEDEIEDDVELLYLLLHLLLYLLLHLLLYLLLHLLLYLLLHLLLYLLDVEDEVEDVTREEAENEEKDEAEDKEKDEVQDEKKGEGEDENKDEGEGEDKDEMEDVAKVVARKEAEDKEKDEVEGEEEDMGEEEGNSQSARESWLTAPNNSRGNAFPRGIETGRRTPPRPRIRKKIPHSPSFKKRQAPGISKVTLAEKMRDSADLIQPGVDGEPAIYELWKSVVVENKYLGIVKFDIGPRLRTKQEERVLMIVGQTGAGKTTMINGLANYVYGVRWEDDFRFKIITEKGDVNADDRAHSQTKGVSAYSFNWKEGMTIPYTLTVIDTPGFGDSEGLRRDEELVVKVNL
ncbi:unnamed protein product [Darwinula stevensoni]|uniref:Septin-type G domain-containing protein n=1 Tax=Darwinula stevensoni TaxID=69355 RepID=A0A7R9ABT9_9CRUS|nr:unnamed protein product [Darwinula stevensoni]CAG0899251.1 unnamed protein product [Darwinula stevensoni]